MRKTVPILYFNASGLELYKKSHVGPTFEIAFSKQSTCVSMLKEHLPLRMGKFELKYC